jgi:hypothetical protein
MLFVTSVIKITVYQSEFPKECLSSNIGFNKTLRNSSQVKVIDLFLVNVQ